MTKRRIALIGVGKIARDQHLPVIDKSDAFELVATVSTSGAKHRSLPVFATPAELFRAMPDIDAVAICTPPDVRSSIAHEALDAGVDVLLEKPPAPTLSEFAHVVAHAERASRVLFQTWHSQHNAAVEETRRILAAEGLGRLRIDWRESVRKWHPGQEWVWQPGGFGVFDPGINALSILARILPFPVTVASAHLQVPANRQTPVDASLVFASREPHQPEITAGFNWLEESGEVWTIRAETLSGRELSLERGGASLRIDGGETISEPATEYEQIYARFAELLDRRESEVDDTPLRWVADAFTVGSRETVEAFNW